jgi:hypothetical protein
MKRKVTFALLGIVLTSIISSCGAAKGGHCDAYGKVDANNSNLHASK